MQAEQKRGGRPTTKATEGQKATLGIRASADLKTRLDAEAKRNGRSLSQEAEIRLEQSFRQEATINEALGGKEIATLARELGAAADMIAVKQGQDWRSGYKAYLTAEVAWIRLFDEFRKSLRPPQSPQVAALMEARLRELTSPSPVFVSHPGVSRPSSEELTEEFYAGRTVGTGLFVDAFSQFTSIEAARDADKRWREYDAWLAQLEEDRRRSAEPSGPQKELERLFAEIDQLGNETAESVSPAHRVKKS